MHAPPPGGYTPASTATQKQQTQTPIQPRPHLQQQQPPTTTMQAQAQAQAQRQQQQQAQGRFYTEEQMFAAGAQGVHPSHMTTTTTPVTAADIAHMLNMTQPPVPVEMLGMGGAHTHTTVTDRTGVKGAHTRPQLGATNTTTPTTSAVYVTPQHSLADARTRIASLAEAGMYGCLHGHGRTRPSGLRWFGFTIYVPHNFLAGGFGANRRVVLR